MKHNDMKRNNEMRDTVFTTRKHSGSCGRLLRIFLLLVVTMTVGATGVWGQTVDYSGTYYIGAPGNSGTRNTANYYLCPTENWRYYDSSSGITSDNNGQPFITTYQCLDKDNYTYGNAVWTIEKHSSSDFYYIKQFNNGKWKYLTHNTKMPTSTNIGANRIRLHLEESPNNDDDALFAITFVNSTSSYDIAAKNASDDNIYLNVNKGNQPSLQGSGSAEGGVDLGGTIGLWKEGGSKNENSRWYLEDVIENPIVSINSDRKAIISSSNATATYYYTTDGTTTPTTTTGVTCFLYDAENPIDITGIETIKAIASLNGQTSNVVTYTVGTGMPYLIQNQECTAYYLVPGDPNKTDVPATTSSIAGPKMEWLLKFAGNVNGIQYYFFVNNSTKDYLYRSSDYVYVKSSSDIIPSDDGYKFNFFAKNADESYNIFPKGNTKNSLYKRGYNASADGIQISNKLTDNYYHWKFISTSGVTDKKDFFDTPMENTGTELSLSSASDGAFYYFISNVGTANNYIASSPNNAVISTTSEPAENESWMLVKADEDNWQTYYHLVSAATGKYMHFIGTDASSTLDINNAIEMQEQPSGIADQFVLARATNANTYYIIPKLHYNTFKDNKYYCLNDNSSQVKTTLSRASNVNTVKWTFKENTSSFCLDPIFEKDDEGNVSLFCPTIGAEIHFTDNGDTPDKESTPYDDDSWEPSEQKLIKAIAVLKNDKNTSSDIITLLNNPDITLNPEYTNYTYDGESHEPGVTDVSITVGGNTFSSPSPATYTATYTNNVNAGTATVTLTDVEGDLWYIWNGSTTFTIGKKAITITAADDTREYNGTSLTNDSYTCDPALATGDSFESVTVTGSQTAVGSISNVPSAAVIVNGNDEDVTANYAITYVNGTLTVTLRSIGEGTLASGFTLEFGEGGAIILKDGEETLTKNTDYTVATTSETSKYSTRTVSGDGNYTGSINIRNANVNFQNDGNGGTEYSATFVAENALGSASNNSANGHALPEGITAYIITSISGNNANAEALEYIPEGIPVLLLSNADSGGFLVQDASGHTAITPTQKDNNMLEEVTNDPSKHFNFREIYLLYMNEFVHNLEGDLAKGKVYLNPSHSSGGGGGGGNSRLFIRWDTETGIDNSHLSPLTPHPSGSWYTLDGRRLNRKPTQKGLYLCNGQKTVVN